MAKATLDRISMGNFENSDDKKILDNKGDASFRLYSKGRLAFEPYYIIGKLAKGGIFSSENVLGTNEPNKEEFLKEVNENLAQIDCYLGQAQYSKVFTILGMPTIKGILYNEIPKNPRAKGKR